MKKIVLAGWLVALSGIAMGQAQEKKVDGYVIHGVIEGNYNADKVYLVEEEEINGQSKIIDSAKVENNRYTFEGSDIKYPRMYFIKSGDPECTSPITPFFLENGVINIRSNAKYFLNSDVRGSINNDIFSLYNVLTKNLVDSLQRAVSIERRIYGDREKEYENAEFKRRSDLMKRRNLDIAKHFAETYKGQPFAPFVIYWAMRYNVSLEELKALRNTIDPKLNDHPYMNQLNEYIRLAEFAVGSEMPDFSLPDANGKMVHIRDFRGKYVLIDFWASWCGPCLREMPNVVKLYQECKGKNFEILGVSLDSKREAWLAAVKKNKMKWPQVSDLKMWSTAPAKLCNVRAIPYTVLLDPEGKVIALELRGEELIAKIKEMLNKK